jgi:hypothetical protein
MVGGQHLAGFGFVGQRPSHGLRPMHRVKHPHLFGRVAVDVEDLQRDPFGLRQRIGLENVIDGRSHVEAGPWICREVWGLGHDCNATLRPLKSNASRKRHYGYPENGRKIVEIDRPNLY